MDDTPQIRLHGRAETERGLRGFVADPVAFMRKLQREQGDFAEIREANQRILFLFHPRYNQAILGDPATFEARFFAIRGPKKSAQRKLTCGLLGMNGEQHKRNRRLVKEPFGKRAIATYDKLLDELSEEQLRSWKQGQVIDLSAEMTRYLLRVTSSILFGLDDPDTAFRLGEMIEHWAKLNHQLGPGAVAHDEEFSASYESLLAYAEELEREIMQLIRRRRNDPRPGHDVLSILVNTYDEAGTLSDEELVGQAAVLFAAAHLTTAHSLTWTLTLLAQHPEIEDAVREELAAERPAEMPSPQLHGQRLTQLDLAIRESMRILPASSYSQRVAMRSAQVAEQRVERGTLMFWSPFMTHRREELYPQADRFLPQRWRSLRPSPYEYLPFGAGPRMCIGGPLAMAIVRQSLPRILQKFRLRLVQGATVNARVISTMLMPTTEVPVELHAPETPGRTAAISGTLSTLVAFPAAEKGTSAPSRSAQAS